MWIMKLGDLLKLAAEAFGGTYTVRGRTVKFEVLVEYPLKIRSVSYGCQHDTASLIFDDILQYLAIPMRDYLDAVRDYHLKCWEKYFDALDRHNNILHKEESE